MTIIVEWIDRGKFPEHPPDPNFPKGIDIDMSFGARRSCLRDLPWPAARIGFYQIMCLDCGQMVMVTTAGRVDDPRSVKLACKLNG